MLGALLVFFMFPRREKELELLRLYHAEDSEAAAALDATVDES